MNLSQLVSSDSHIQEPPDLWYGRMSDDLKERGPRVISEESGDFWWCDGKRACSFVGGTQVGKRFEAPGTLVTTGRFKDVREATYVAAGYVADNLSDKVEGSVLYPTAGLLFFSVEDSLLLNELCHAYNDWMAEFTSFDRNRLKGVGMVNLDDIEVGVKEMERCKRAGLCGVLLATYPDPRRPYSLAEYDRVWAASQDLELPLSLHLGTNRRGLVTPGQFQEMQESTFLTADAWIRRSLADMIFGGVFERFPRLHVGSIENGLGWAPHFLDRMDNLYTERPRHDHWRRFKDPTILPSDVYRQSIFMSFQDDKRGLAERKVLGVSQLMWGSDYPHTESTFPHSAQVLEEMFEELKVDAEEAALISSGNACRVYGFEPVKTATPFS